MKSAGAMRRGALALLKAVGRMSSTPLYQKMSARIPRSVKERARHVLLNVAAGGRTAIGSPWNESDAEIAEPALPPPPVSPQTMRGSDGRGANIIGYVRGALGLAENVRSFARALHAKGFPIALVDANVLEAERNVDDSMALGLDAAARYEIDVFFVNPDHLDTAIRELKGSVGRYRIGYWFWELESVPQEWLPAIDLVDEIWVSSQFVKDAFSRVTRKPVTLIPMPVEVDTAQLPVRVAREGGVFTFLFSFDFHSYVQRKNPAAVIEAFLKAFPKERHDVQLIIKCTNGGIFRDQYYELMSEASKDQRILVSDGFVRRRQMLELVNRADAYVSLHRSEGFGLGLAESMYLGKAVIGTGYSGNLEFMTPDNSCLTDFSMIAVKPGDYVHGEGQQWAQANTDTAAAYMRRLVDEPGYAEQLGARASEYMHSHHSRERCSDVAIRRLRQIQEELDPKAEAGRAGMPMNELDGRA